MNSKVTIEVDPKHEAIVRRALAMAEEMEQLALSAPDGTVFDACEEAVIEKGRKLQGQVLREPDQGWAKPSLENLEYHAHSVFR